MEQQNKPNAFEILNSNAHWGTRALIQLMHNERLPIRYTDDVAIDIDLLYRVQPRCFVVVLRECGCDIGVPYLESTHERVRFWGKEDGARIFTVEVYRDVCYKTERKGISAAMEWLRRKEAEIENCASCSEAGAAREN